MVTGRRNLAFGGQQAKMGKLRFPRKMRVVATAVFAVAAFSGATPSRLLPRYGAFVFSDVCIEPGSGDSAGHWMSLTRDAMADILIY